MSSVRIFRQYPFCWQDKPALRLLRQQWKEGKLTAAEHVKLRNLYLSLTEIESDFGQQEIRGFTRLIHHYSGLSEDFIPKGVKFLEKLGLCKTEDLRDKHGRFAGRVLRLISPCGQNVENFLPKPGPGSTVPGKSGNGETAVTDNKTSGLSDVENSYKKINNNKKLNRLSSPNVQPIHTFSIDDVEGPSESPIGGGGVKTSDQNPLAEVYRLLESLGNDDPSGAIREWQGRGWSPEKILEVVRAVVDHKESFKSPLGFLRFYMPKGFRAIFTALREILGPDVIPLETEDIPEVLDELRSRWNVWYTKYMATGDPKVRAKAQEVLRGIEKKANALIEQHKKATGAPPPRGGS